MEESETSENNIIIQKSHDGKLILIIIVAVGLAAFLAGYVFANETADPEQITVQESPQILEKSSPQSPSQGPLRIPKIISSDDDPMIGDPDAEFTIVEFSDFQCPFCAKFHSDTLPLLMQNYINNGKVNLVFRDFPIESTHPNAVPAAHASECADDQGKFWEIHDMIFENQGNWKNMDPLQSLDLFKKYSIEIGVDGDVYDSCMSTAKHIDEIKKDLEDGRDYGVTGTPGFFVGNKEVGFTKIIGAQPFSSFQRVIDGFER